MCQSFKTYHEWMKSEELLELTASESLTLEEEYGMQRVSPQLYGGQIVLSSLRLTRT